MKKNYVTVAAFEKYLHFYLLKKCSLKFNVLLFFHLLYYSTTTLQSLGEEGRHFLFTHF